MFTLFYIGFWFLYFIVGMFLFALNFFVFKRLSGIDVDYTILQSQNRALSKVVKWQLIWQSIMISTIIYFMGVSFDKVFVDWVFHLTSLLQTFQHIFTFGVFGIILFQFTLFVISKVIPLYKEILVDENTALWEIVEGILIAMSLLISIAVFSY